MNSLEWVALLNKLAHLTDASGKRKVLGDVVRVPCRMCGGEYILDTLKDGGRMVCGHSNCHEGTVASTRQEDWEKAALMLPEVNEIQIKRWPGEKVVVSLLRLGVVNITVGDGIDPNPKAALLLAIEKAVTNDHP